MINVKHKNTNMGKISIYTMAFILIGKHSRICML
jgi:hypothetical protein